MRWRSDGNSYLRALLAFTVASTTAASVVVGCTGTSSTQVDVRKEEPATESTTTTMPPDCAQMLPPAAQAGQLLMVMVTSPNLATDVVTGGLVGGFGLKGRQSSDVGDQIAEAIADAPVQPFVASDEEGGTVQRLGLALGELPSAAEMADDTPSAAGKVFAEYSAAMAELGFNMNFGPVVDVGSGSDLGTRSFGDDPSTVSAYTDVIIKAQEKAGLISVVKHWPGIGGGVTDPHLALSELAPIDQLRTKDLVAFQRAFDAGASGVMVAHSAVPGLGSGDEPASLSRAAITDELRGRMGFDGLVMTDSLGMGAIVNTTPQDEAAERAILAGADIALLSGADVVEAAHERLTEAITAGRIPTDQVEASLRRVLTAKGIEGDCVDIVAAYSSKLQDDDSSSADPGTTGTASIPDAGINDTSGTSSGGTSSGGTSSGGSGTTTTASRPTRTTVATQSGSD